MAWLNGFEIRILKGLSFIILMDVWGKSRNEILTKNEHNQIQRMLTAPLI